MKKPFAFCLGFLHTQDANSALKGRVFATHLGMKKEVLVFVTIAILIFIFFIVNANSRGEGKISAEVKEKIEEGDKEIRVFINIKEDKKEEVADLIGKNKVKYEFENSVSAVIDKKDLEKLEKDWRVENVELVGVRKIFLSSSVPLINGTATWGLQFNGINLTGKDQTICILDTGVNYSHIDLGGCYGNNSLSSGCKVWGGWDYCADDGSLNCTTEDTDPIDVNGHGTHVSGIAAANGTVRGVAPESRIIMLKVCSSTGSCYDDAIKSGIDWCVNNASVFNISVISMSLGGGLYSNYCNDDPLAGNINSAVGSGISVVIAAGNDGSTTQIAAPACVQNATPIGSIRKDDSTIDYNRNSLLNLLTPGWEIYSTYLGAGHATLSGTSMATPHAAGAIAIIKQFLNLTGQLKTPKEIETVLNNTGKRIPDSSNGLNFSRINIYDAIISLDNREPNVTLISPSNNLISSNLNQSFRCNATDLSLKNATFYLLNSSSSYNITTGGASGAFNLLELNITDIPTGRYNWTCAYYDEKGNSAFATSNFSLTIGKISVSLLSPPNGDYTNINATNFSCQTISESNNALSNITFYLWNSSSLAFNETKNISGTSNLSIFNYTFRYENSYRWNCLGKSNDSNLSFSESNFTIVFDISKPVVNLSGPADGFSATGTTELLFEYNASDNFNLGACELILNGAVVASNSSGILNSGNFSNSTTPGSYTWSVNCSDRAGNIGNSTSRSLTINSAPAAAIASSGGGGSIISGQTFNAGREQISQGYTKELSKEDKVVFEIFDEVFVKHTLSVDFVGDNFVNISVRSEPIIIILGIGQSIKLNLTSPDYYNLLIKLESIANKKAKLTIQTIYESIAKKVEAGNVTEEKDFEGEKLKEKESEKKSPIQYIIGAIILIVILALVGRIIYVKSREEIKEEVIEEVEKEFRKKRIKKPFRVPRLKSSGLF